MRKQLTFLFLLIAVPLIAKQVFDAMGGTGEDWLKPLLVPAANLFLSTFNSPGFAMVMSGFIGLLALLAAFTLSRKAANATRIMDQARRRLEAQSRSGTQDRTLILAALDVHPAVLNLGERVLGDETGERDLEPDATARAFEQRLRWSLFDGNGVSFAMYRQMPEFFVSAGLVLTFCGLVAGLYFASRGLLAADLAVAKDALNKLLAASTFKFMTSIAGIGGALILTVTNRIVYDNLEATRAALAEAVFRALAMGGRQAATAN